MCSQTYLNKILVTTQYLLAICRTEKIVSLFFSWSNPLFCIVFMWLTDLKFKICAEVVVHRMFAVFLNSLNGKNSSSIVRDIFFFYVSG